MKKIPNCCIKKNSKLFTLEQHICNICNFDYKYFLSKANVHAIGLGFKRTNGIYTNKLCISIFVSKKIPLFELTPSNHIPPIYKFVETDVIEATPVVLSSTKDRIRPTVCGYSIGNELSKAAGTIGALVTDGKNLFILSNNHVLTNLNSAPPRIKILQPAILDGGKVPNDVIALLDKFVPLKFSGTIQTHENLVDCALAKVITPSTVSPIVKSLGIPAGVIVPQLKSYVQKVGRTSDISNGIISNTNVTFKIKINKKLVIFKKQIIANMYSNLGDSGSLILNEKNFAVGLLLGLMDGFTVFSPISTVLKELKVNLITK